MHDFCRERRRYLEDQTHGPDSQESRVTGLLLRLPVSPGWTSWSEVVVVTQGPPTPSQVNERRHGEGGRVSN